LHPHGGEISLVKRVVKGKEKKRVGRKKVEGEGMGNQDLHSMKIN
jgi:hypothetical protein